MFGPIAMKRPRGFRQWWALESALRTASLLGRCSRKLLVNTTSNSASASGHESEQSCWKIFTSDPAALRISGFKFMAYFVLALILLMNSLNPAPRSSTALSGGTQRLK